MLNGCCILDHLADVFHDVSKADSCFIRDEVAECLMQRSACGARAVNALNGCS